MSLETYFAGDTVAENGFGTPDCWYCKQMRELEQACPNMFGKRDSSFPPGEPQPCLRLIKTIGDLTIETVFLHARQGNPFAGVWYETTAYRCGGETTFSDRYPTKGQAVVGHYNAVVRAKRGRLV